MPIACQVVADGLTDTDPKEGTETVGSGGERVVRCGLTDTDPKEGTETYAWAFPHAADRRVSLTPTRKRVLKPMIVSTTMGD